MSYTERIASALASEGDFRAREHGIRSELAKRDAEIARLTAELCAEQDKRSDVIRERNEAIEEARNATAVNRILKAEVPQLEAEVTSLTAELAAAREAAQRDRDVAQAMAKAAHDAEEQLAAARAVPADVEAAIGDLKIAAADFGIAQDGVATGCTFATEHRGEASARMRSATDALRTAIARAISDATAGAVGEFIDRHAKRLCEQAGESWNRDDEEAEEWASDVHDVLNHLRADETGHVHDGRKGG